VLRPTCRPVYAEPVSLPSRAQDSVPGKVAGLLPGRELHPLEAPGLPWRTEEPSNVCFYDIGIGSKLQSMPESFYRLSGTLLWTIARAVGQEVCFEDRAQDARHRDLQERIFQGWEAQGTVCAFAFRSPSPSHQLRPVGASFEPLHEVSDVRHAVLSILVSRHPIDATGRIFSSMWPTAPEKNLVEHAKKVAKPVLLVALRLVRSSLQ
jgi:hypothetical protein